MVETAGCDVAVILPRLIGAAEDHLIHRQTGMQIKQTVNHMGGHVIGADHGQRAAMAADGGAARGAEKDIGHLANSGAGR